MADMDPYPGLKKKDKEFLESVNSKIRSGTYRDPESLRRNLKTMNNRLSGYQAKLSSYERSNTRKKIDTLSQARLRMQEAGIAPAPNLLAPVEESSGNSASLVEEPVLAPMGLEAIEELPENRESLQEATNQVVNVPVVWRKFVTDHIADEKKDIDRKIRNGEDIDEEWDFFGLVNAKSESETNKNGNGGHERFKPNEAEYIKKTLSDYIRSRVPPVVAPAAVPVAAPAAVAGSSKKVFKLKKSMSTGVTGDEVGEDLVAATQLPIYYDPRTGEQLSGSLDQIAHLEKIIRELKGLRNTIPVGLYGLRNDTSNYEFLLNVFCNPSISLDDMVSFKLASGNQVGADIFEVLSRLFVFFGGIENVNPRDGGNYRFMMKIERPEEFDTVEKAFTRMKCKATRDMGLSDITLNYVDTKSPQKPAKLDDPYCEIPCVLRDESVIKTYLMSVKWYKKEKSSEHYDLEKLYAAANKLTTLEQQPVGIIVFLKSKHDFQLAHNRAYRQYVKGIANTFFGWDEDIKPFLQEIRRSIFESSTLLSIAPSDVILSQYIKKNSKPMLSLQLHQDIIVSAINNAFSRYPENDDQRYLIGVLPRGGKTFIAGGIIREFLRRNTGATSLNIFWITAAPNETRSQVSSELVDKFQDFDEFEFIEARNSDDLSNKTKRYTIWFCSIQLLTLAKAGKAKERKSLQKTMDESLGLVFFDEAHKGGSGEESKKVIDGIIQRYSTKFLPFIFLTATYYNIMIDYQIHKDNIFIWDYTDVLQTRAIGTDTERDDAISNLQGRFGKELVKEIIERRIKNGETYEIMGKAYLQFPDLYFLSADFQAETIERFRKDNMYREKQGFSLGSIFKLKPEHSVRDIRTSDNKIKKSAWLAFENPEHPRNIVSLLTPSDEMNKFITQGEGLGGDPLVQEIPGLEPSILGRIDKLSRAADSRFSLSERPTILMFMPVGGTGSNIRHLLPAWGSLLMDHKWWSDRYEVVCVMDEDTLKEENVGALLQDEREQGQPVEILNNITIIQSNPKVNILTLERKLKCSESKKGLVILAGDKLSMGVSLPCTDVVMLLNDSKSPDDIIQKMYRALTPSKGKKASFVVDINPVRTLAAVYGYTRASHETLNNKSQLLDIITDVYSWDTDIFEFSVKRGSESRPLDFQARMKQLIDEAETDQAYRIMENIGGFEKRVENNIRRRLHTNASATELIKSKFSERDSRIISTIGLRNKSSFSLQKGTLIIKQPRASPAEGNEQQGSVEKQEDLELIIVNFAETVTDFIKYLAITTSKNTLEEALDEFESKAVEENTTSRLDTNVIKLVRDRSSMKGVISDDMLSKLLVQAVKEFAISSSKEVFRQMKGKIDEPSLRKDAVLQVIYKHITPKKRQKEESGEVFTPIEFIEEMLSHLPKSLWKNPNLKWLDPANGIGNFPVVVFYKLDEGLRSLGNNKELGVDFSNETQRRKYIIENMLYMLELQSNNTRIARNIFEKLCGKCKPNILTTDSLKITAEGLAKKGFPEKYDVIIGNPPFNAGGLMKGTGFWARFVRLAFELVSPNGFITFVHPPGWRKFYDPEEKENQGKILYDIREKGWNIKYINVSDQPPKHFPIVDYYVIHAKKTNSLTKYDSKFMGIISNGEGNLDYPFIPNIIDNNVLSIIDKLFKAKGIPIHIIRGSNFEPSKKDIGNPGIPHYHFTTRTGDRIFYNKEYDVVPDYINKDKVLMTFSGGYEKGRLFAFYSDEKVGATRTAMYMLVNDKDKEAKNKEENAKKGAKLVNFFNSDIVTFLMKITQYSASPNHKNEFKILNQLQIPDSLDYGLTPKEEVIIKKVLGTKEDVELVKAEGEEEPEAKGGRRKPHRVTRKIRR